MDTSGLTSVTTSAEMLVWLAENCLTPIQPGMSGTDFGVILQKMLSLTDATNAQIAAYLQSLPGYTGEGTRFLADDLTWRESGVARLTSPVPSLSSTVTNATLSWQAIPGALTYTIERALDSGFTNTLTTVYTGPAETFTDTGLSTGTTEYFYRVNANAPNFPDSPWSVTVSTGAVPVVPG